MDTFINNYEEFVVLPFSDFSKLKTIAEMRQKDCATVINVEDLLFLSALVDYYSTSICTADEDGWRTMHGSVYLEIYKNTVTLHVSYYQEEIINSSFSLDICKKYYNNVNKFIEEVL